MANALSTLKSHCHYKTNISSNVKAFASSGIQIYGFMVHTSYCHLHKKCLPRPIEDATPRAIHHNPNRKYFTSSSTCCRTRCQNLPLTNSSYTERKNQIPR